MINYLLNLKLVNGGGKFSVNRQVAGRPITEKSVSIRQQFANSVHKICSRLDDRASDDIEVFIMARQAHCCGIHLGAGMTLDVSLE
jgi:hypothetical protein